MIYFLVTSFNLDVKIEILETAIYSHLFSTGKLGV